MDEYTTKAEARLQAIEYLLANMYAKVLLAQDDPLSATESGIKGMLDGFKAVTIPDVDPVVSDFAAGEMHDAMERLLSMIREMVTTELDAQ